MRLLLLSTAALLLSTVPLALAGGGCTPVQADRLEGLEAVPGLPHGWLPVLALDDSRLPPIPRIAASGPKGLCDVTADLPGFARAAGVADPARLATLAVATSFPDQLGLPQVRELVLDGGIARVTTWSERDGLVVDWTVDLATLRADWVVRDVRVGAYVTDDWEGWHVWEGFSSDLLRDLENGLLVTKTKMQPLPDGNAFRFTYFTQFYASEAQADQYAEDYADAALAIWEIQNQEWGFTSGDADGVYDIRMDGCSCISGGFNVNIRVHAKLEDLFNFFNPPLQYPSNQHFYRVVIGHEWHHHLQYTINQWTIGQVLTEGGARFSETIFEPEGAFGPNVIQTLPNGNGFANVMLRPNTPLSSRTYDFGLFWGYLFGQDGGIDILREVYVQSDNVGGNGNTALPGVVTNALAAVGNGPHETFEEAYADFAIALFQHKVEWGLADGSDVRNWATYLPPVARLRPTEQANGAVNLIEGSVVERGIQVVDAKRASPMAGSYVGSSSIQARWAVTTPSGTTVVEAPNVLIIEEGGILDAALVLVRGNAVANDPVDRVVGSGSFRAAFVAPAQALP